MKKASVLVLALAVLALGAANNVTGDPPPAENAAGYSIEEHAPTVFLVKTSGTWGGNGASNSAAGVASLLSRGRIRSVVPLTTQQDAALTQTTALLVILEPIPKH